MHKNIKKIILFFVIPPSPFTHPVALAKNVCPGVAFDPSTPLRINCALAKTDKSYDTHFKLGFEHYLQKNYEQALGHFYKLIELDPNNSLHYFNMGIILQKLGKFEASNSYLHAYLELKPDDKEAHKHLRANYLILGDLQKGYYHADIFNKEKDAEYKYLWHGSCLSGKTIYIVDNIGIGDVFCFIQYAKHMKDQGGKVILGVRDYLMPIMSSCPFVDKVVPRFQDTKNCNCYTHVTKLPRMAYKAGFDIPGQVPYLFADEALIKKWANILAKDKYFKIGICWDASLAKDPKTGGPVRTARSIPLRYFYELSKLPNVSLYSLQRVNGTEQLESMPQDFNIHAFDEDFDKTHGSFMDTAAVMKHLDLVITVDTSVAHLAGALGAPVWLLLNHAGNWRWFLDREDSPWYPTMRIFRQKKRGDWDFVMQQVVAHLRDILPDNLGK